MRPGSAATLAHRLLAGEQAALARAITLIERGAPEVGEVLRTIHDHLGRARTIGVTGSPGVGKSTLVNALVHAFRARDHRVGVIAVDPSSPLSGGAILGDRIRMGDHELDPDVFIRSLASRGECGGLSVAAGRVADLMDAGAYDRIILETVGAGQAEVDIAELAEVRVVVCAPGLGDEVQAAKAGILEIADVLVMNKSDLPLADATERELRSAVALRGVRATIPIVKTTASQNKGIDGLYAAIEAETAARAGDPQRFARQRMRRLIAKAAARLVEQRVLRSEDEVLAATCDAVQRGDLTPEQAAMTLLKTSKSEEA